MMEATKGKSFFHRLKNGDLGLAKTYWIYGVLVEILVNLFAGFVPSMQVLAVLMVFFMIYKVVVIIGTWRAANRYEGDRKWAVMAKVATVFSAFSTTLSVFAIFYLALNPELIQAFPT